MLTRLKIAGFKNLVDVDIRFGPFTCVAGPNAVGKSNLFDAIRFLSTAASKTLMEAALSVRSLKASNADVRDLFHRSGTHTANHMRFEVEMVSPKEAFDDLGQQATATANFLRYTLELRLREGRDVATARGPLEITKEELVHIHLKQAGRHLPFSHDPVRWRKSALRVERRTAPFISTIDGEQGRVIMLHQDGGGRGRAVSNPATQPRTVLSVANAAECPTVLCARREMESWQLLQLEPAALREPDGINAPTHLSSNGAHLASTLYHLANNAERTGTGNAEGAAYCRAVNRLAELIADVADLEVDRDDKRELLTLKVTSRDGATYPAKSLSDGTLRFLALTVLEMDTNAHGVVCLEEPENGIHPERIPAMLRLLQDIATDPAEPLDDTNPLRQVIVNTHSPGVVLEAPDDSLLVVESREDIAMGKPVHKAVFSHLPDTWRSRADVSARTVPNGCLLAYLNPAARPRPTTTSSYTTTLTPASQSGQARRRVADRDDLGPYLPGLGRVAE
jgi:predicted ATPase